MDQPSATALSDDEFAVLLIAAEGESMIPIGRWQAPVENLVARGFLRQLDRFNNVITTEGRKAIDARNKDDEGAIRQASRAVMVAQAAARTHVEEAAQSLASAARASTQATGDRADTAVLNWNAEVLRRALELVCE
jgi:hypothetical protein